MVDHHQNIETDLLELIPKNLAVLYRILPYQMSGSALKIFCDESLTNKLKNELEILLNCELIKEQVSTEYLNELINICYKNHKRSQTLKFSSLENFPDELIEEALRLNSSDIHIESIDKYVRVRFRVDGKLLERNRYHLSDQPSLVNKIKVQANLDISEKRLPQDGRMLFSKDEIDLDLRVSCIPGSNGEKLVLRLLKKDASYLNLDDIGLSESQKKIFRQNLKHQNGIILISGPTGSGKTSTLYACLKELNNPDVNILTIEDPIEFRMQGITQVQVKELIGLDFSKALRSFLRQDPDIIMLGEIRDAETAQIATRAALTGHLIFSTIHTNSAWASISRLMDLGVAPFLIAGTLRMSIAQRLIRKLCDNCKIEIYENSVARPPFLDSSVRLFQSNGCAECYYTGYKGRRAIYEIIPIDDELLIQIKNGKSDENQILKKAGISTLSDQVLGLLEQGVCTMEDALPIFKNRI